MATSFSINARRIRDLQEVTTSDNQFVPSASYVLVDAADANNMYTSYKMKVSALSDAISGMIASDTIEDIKSTLNSISSNIKLEVENVISTDILAADEFKENVALGVANQLVSNEISAQITSALIEKGILSDIISGLNNNGISLSVANNLTSDQDFNISVINNFRDKLTADTIFMANVVGQLQSNYEFRTNIASNIADKISSSTEFTTAIVEPVAVAVSGAVSAALTADTNFINTLKDLINSNS